MTMQLESSLSSLDLCLRVSLRSRFPRNSIATLSTKQTKREQNTSNLREMDESGFCKFQRNVPVFIAFMAKTRISKLLAPPLRPCGGIATGVKDGDEGQWHPKPTAPKKSFHTRRPKHPAGALVIYMYYVFTSAHMYMYNIYRV